MLEESAKDNLDQNEINQKVFNSLFQITSKKNQVNSDEDTEPVWISISLLLKML